MFSSKNKFDIKKSTQKFVDLKKDLPTRCRHLKTVLENLDHVDLKNFFEIHASHIFFIFMENFALLECGIKQKGARGARDELDAVFSLLENILVYIPEILHKRWHYHSLMRIFLKLLHPQNNVNLRRESIKLFIMWYQILGEEATDQAHAVFATLIPSFPSPFTGLGLCNITLLRGPIQGPISDQDILPLVPASPGDRSSDDLPRFFLEGLLRAMVNQLTKIRWRDRTQRLQKSFSFLFESFKRFYIETMFPEFRPNTSIYKPSLEMPSPRRIYAKDPLQSCRVELIKWVSNFIHVPVRESVGGGLSPWAEATASSHNLGVAMRSDLDFQGSSTPSSLSVGSDQGGTEEIQIVQEVLFGSRMNVNFIHEIFRQAFLLTFSHSLAICKVISVYRDWITRKVDLPPFILEPIDLTYMSKYEDNSRSDSRLSTASDASRSIEVPDGAASAMKHRANSFLQQNKEYFLVRAGLQNVLQTFITNSANVFLLDLGRDVSIGLLEEQVDICKKVLNVYRFMVMNVKMDQRTWEQLLAVLLHMTSLILSRGKVSPDETEALPDRLAGPLCQTLVVTWIRANLNVSVSPHLWDQYVKVMSSLTEWEELVKEWAKTVEALTRILARNLYNLELNDLPLDRLTELKAKKRRGNLGEPTFRTPRGSPKKEAESGDSVSRYLSAPGHVASGEKAIGHQTALRHRKVRKCDLKRSYSDGCIPVRRKEGGRRRGMTDPLVDPSDDDEDLFRPRMRPREFSHTERRSLNRWYSCESYLQAKKVASEDEETDEDSRCSSPAPSSGLESTSIRDAAMQIDGLNLDSHSMDTIESIVNENCSVMLGGVRRGWTPDSAALLWRRMLCSLGDINEIVSPETHAKVFEHFLQLAATLVKIRLNQGVSLDNLSTPPAPDYIPPLHIFIPWCFESFKLPESHVRGRLAALKLLCYVCVRQWDLPVHSEFLTAFYQYLHRGLTSGNQETINVIFRSCIPRYFSLQLPGYSLLLQDFMHAANYVINSSEIQGMPRTEAVSLLGSLMFFPEMCQKLSVLEPVASELKIGRCQDFKEPLLSLLLRAGKREPTPLARCISICSLAIFVYKELEAKQFHPKMTEAVLILLNALRQCSSAMSPARGSSNRASEFRVKTVAQIACDMLYLISDHAEILVRLAPDIACRIVEETAGTLANLVVSVDGALADEDKRLFLSLELTIAEWCMRLPLPLLLQPWPNPHSTSLLDAVLKVLKITQSLAKPSSVLPTPDLLPDFENDAREEPTPGSNASTLTPSTLTPSHLNGSLSRGGRREKGHNNLSTIRMGAQFIMEHLLNQLGHFPLGSDAARHTSMVSEFDDLPNVGITSLFDSPNVQIFVLDRTKLLSFVELPVLLGPGGGIPAGLQTDKTEVRVIVRDLNGKHCWDTAILHSDCEVLNSSVRRCSDPSLSSSGLPHFSSQSEDQVLMSTSMIGGNPLALPHHTVRYRPIGELPTSENTEADMDNLHDLLSYVKHTSAEVCGDSELTCPKPPPSCLTSDMEDEAITYLLSQKTQELDFVAKFSTDITMTSQPCEEPDVINTHVPFHLCRMLISQLGLLSWEHRGSVQLLKKNEQLLRELKNLDNQKCRETHKIAVIYVAQGQEDKVSILSNNAGSPEFEDFVARLGWEVELESHKGFMGGLQRNGSTGETAPYYATSLLEVIYHVSTRMPSDSQECLLQKTRHLGNDEVHIVWSEHTRDYRRGIIPTEFCDVLIIIYPLQNGLYRIQVSKKLEVPFIGPLFNESIVNGACLPGLVRATALNASRAKRSLLPLYQTFFEERYYALESLVDQFALPSSFEEFCSQVLYPASLGNFQPGTARISSGSLLSAQHQQHEPVSLTSLQFSVENSPRLGMHYEDQRRVSDVSAPDIDESPRPSKRLSFKQASRFVHGLGFLPDVSPVTDHRKFPK